MVKPFSPFHTSMRAIETLNKNPIWTSVGPFFHLSLRKGLFQPRTLIMSVSIISVSHAVGWMVAKPLQKRVGLAHFLQEYLHTTFLKHFLLRAFLDHTTRLNQRRSDISFHKYTTAQSTPVTFNLGKDYLRNNYAV